MPDTPTVSTPLLHLILQAGSRRGLDVELLCRQAGLVPNILQDPRARIPAAAFDALLNQLLQTLPPDFSATDLIDQLPYQPVPQSLLETVMVCCPDLLTALQTLARYHALVTDMVQIEMVMDEEKTECCLVSPPEVVPRAPLFMESVTLWLVQRLSALAGALVRPEIVRFRHAVGGNPQALADALGCPVVYQAKEDGLTFARRTLAHPIPLADASLHRQLEPLLGQLLHDLAPARPWTEQTTRLIGSLLFSGRKPLLADAARALALSPRSLQMKLAEEESMFWELVERVRKELALQTLQDPANSLADTAFLLGFADQSSFTHAFKRWTGQTPAEYRRQ